ncbi:MAG: cytochrome c3 family protein [Thermoanaerobaculia bacterium]
MTDVRSRECVRPGTSPPVVLLLAALFLLPSRLPAANPCLGCHERPVAAYATTPHAAIVGKGFALCASCHGDPTKHLETGDPADIITGEAVAAFAAPKKADACLTCHRRDFPAAAGAPHREEPLCWSCHEAAALHYAAPVDLPEAAKHRTFALCTSCHEETAAQFRMHYRHPVEQGTVDCTSCHDIHGRELARHDRPAEARCASCHEEQTRPHLFEHAAMDDGCATCHEPHGSPHRGQLKSRGNGICLSCHVQGNFPGVGNVNHNFLLSGGARCWDCHSHVHGSNTTPDLNPRGRR